MSKTTVADDWYQSWLPDASAGGGASGVTKDSRGVETTKEQRFLLQDPAATSTASSGGAARSGPRGIMSDVASSTVPTISKSGLKAQIALIEQEVASYTGAPPELIRRCLHAKRWNARWAASRKADGNYLWVWSYQVGSGLPSGTRIGEQPQPMFVGRVTRGWFTGGDAHLFRVADAGILYTARPLPAGEYRTYYNFSLWNFECGQKDSRDDENEVILTVTAPVGTLAESFFDPYADGAAVGGTTTVGTISWKAGQVEATLNQDFAACAEDHVLDFIRLDGTVLLSLAVTDAVKDTGTLVWTIPDRPWSAEDKLMLRVRRPDAATHISSDSTLETSVARVTMVSTSTFEPYADGAALAGATPFGTISWEPGRITAAPTQEPSGCVQVYLLDFIELEFVGENGAPLLYLEVREAVRDGDTLMWSVSRQPWIAGARLTLRIHRAPNAP